MDAKQDKSTNKPPQREGLRAVLHAWRYFFVILGLLALVALYYLEEDWRGQRTWQNYQAELKTQGLPTAASDLIPPPVSDAENFAMTPLLASVFNQAAGSQMWPERKAVERVQTFSGGYSRATTRRDSGPGHPANSWLLSGIDLVACYGAVLESTNSPYSEREKSITPKVTLSEAARGILASLADLQPVFDELRSSSKRPYARFNLQYDDPNPEEILLPHLSLLKSLCQLLQVRACAELALDKSDAAFGDVQLMLRLMNATRQEPIIISQLVRFALLHLALQPIAEGIPQWSDAQLRQLELELEQIDFCADTKRALEAEAVFFGRRVIDYVWQSQRRGSAAVLAGFGDQWQGNLAIVGLLIRMAPHGWFYLEQVNQERMVQDDLLPTIDLKDHEISPGATRRAESRIAQLTGCSPVTLFLRHRFFSGLLLPATAKVTQRTAFAQTGAGLASLACALERCRRAQGAYPNSLDSLVPRFIDRLPHDVINGKPLIYRLDSGGQYLLYSVGWNEKDDGGSFAAGKEDRSVVQDQGDWVWRPAKPRR